MDKLISVGCSQEVPLIFDVDLLVLGGGLAGLAAALEVAEQKRRVALVADMTFLGHEFTAWQRPWVEWRRAHRDLLCKWLPVGDVAGKAADGQHVPLHMDRLKVKLEDVLLAAGVRLLYASRPVAYRKQHDGWLVIIGNKSGRQAIAARHVVDASESCIMAFLAGHQDARSAGDGDSGSGRKQTTVVRRTLEFTGVHQEGIRAYSVAPDLTIAGDSVTVYPGAFSADHVYVDVPIEVTTSAVRSLSEDSEVELHSRRKSLEVAEYLVHNLPSFSQARLGLGSLQVMWSRGFDPAAALQQGSSLGRRLLRGELNPQDCSRVDSAGWRPLRLPDHSGGCSDTPEAALTYRDETEFSAHWGGPKVAASIGRLSLLGTADVTVVGGGTSGAPAAIVAGREGVSVAVVDMNARLGGTGTVGGVNAHWMSTPNALSDEMDERVAEWEKRVGYPSGRWTWYRRDSNGNRYLWGEDGNWSIEVKAHVLEEVCCEVGASLHFNSFVIGALVEGDQVRGVALATPYGPRALLSAVAIDATGDGDVAAFAGAECVYGNRRDRLTMWSSLAFYREPGGLGNNFTAATDVSDILDYTRFIITSRRRGGELHDHGSYVAPRESRHVAGEVQITLEDQLLLKRYPDTVAVLFSNWDLKGQWFADIVDFGVNPPNAEVEVPYRALIPRRLEQLIIAGKAFSLTHDACAAPRMQRDLILLGGAVGLAAAVAVKNGVAPRSLDIADLQRRLVAAGNLPERVLQHEPAPDPDLQGIVEGLTGDEPFEWPHMRATEKATSVAPVIQLCCAEPGRVVPLLREAYRHADGERRLLLARLLLWRRCGDGADEVLKEIHRQLTACDGLPRRLGDIDWSTGSPEQGIVPEIMFLAYALVRANDRRVVGVLSELVERLALATRDYSDIRAGIYDYIRLVAVAAEHMALPDFIPLLERLLRLPELPASVCPDGIEPDYFKERQAYLVLCLARALARCGAKDGLLRLAELLADSRSLIARSAHQELQAITGMRHPLNRDTWPDALAALPETFPALPWTPELV